jgi:K+-sensing histidine kinase KdpD
MNVISGFSGELVKRLDGENAGLAERINETSDRLMSLPESARKLDKNLDLNPQLEPMNIVPVVERAADQINERYADADITVTLPDELVVLSTPSLETAVWELLDNAAKHAGDNPEISIEATTTADHVEIRITDDGPGLPASERSVLTTGKETPLIHGQGLGLWLVYWIIQSLNGEFTLADHSIGTCIELQLDAGKISTDFSAK